MRLGWCCFLVLIVSRALSTPMASGIPHPEPTGTTICKILADPSTYDNKLVIVHGYVEVSSEYSILVSENCSEHGIWLALADGSALPGLTATVNSRTLPAAQNRQPKITPRIAVRLVRDSGFQRFERYLEASAKGESCATAPPPSFPPECTIYRVSAKFVGRIDSIKKDIRAAKARQATRGAADGGGFGHMGMFDAQLVVQSVQDVVAVDKSKIRSSQPNSR